MKCLFRAAAMLLAWTMMWNILILPGRAEEIPEEPVPESTSETDPPEGAGFVLKHSGEFRSGGVLTFFTEPELENVIYAIRWNGEDSWMVLEGADYILPEEIPAGSSLSVIAVCNEIPADNVLEFNSSAGSTEESWPEETQPGETQPEETQPEETQPEETQPEETQPQEPAGPGWYSGVLHFHSALSGGTLSAEEVYAAAAALPDMDYFVLTDHSHSFDGAENAAIGEDATGCSQDWSDGKAAARSAGTADFLAMFGYEMSWHAQSKLGHITTLNTPGFHTRDQAAFSRTDTALENYYNVLAAQTGSVGQFNHPGNHYGTFWNFAYNEEGDRAISLLEVFSGETNGYDAYVRALDQGWHLAPTGNPGGTETDPSAIADTRTVVYAQSLTEEAICAGLRSRQVYATRDRDLEIRSFLNGHRMGAILPRRQVGQSAQLTVTLHDPTDSSIGQVEVITAGGEQAAVQTVAENWASLAFSLPPEQPYYFLRITQPDGDIAVTAPVWIDQQEYIGIRSLTCETPVPVQDQPIALGLELYNQENTALENGEILIYMDDALHCRMPVSLPAGSDLQETITLTCGAVGNARITLQLTGTLDGVSRCYEASLEVPVRRSREVTQVLLDGSHTNTGLRELNAFRNLAGNRGISLTVAREPATARDLENIRLVVITPPGTEFRAAFLEALREYVAYGGSVLVCAGEDTPQGNAQLNRLLEAIGATARIGDAVELGGSALPSCSFHPEAIRAGVSETAFYRMDGGCEVLAGQGQWLVKVGVPVSGAETYTTVLSREQTGAGGFVLTSGSLFPEDECIREPDSVWELPYANRALALAVLGFAEPSVPLTDIGQARQDTSGELLRVQGYVTAGTSNPYNQFPDTLYLQDDTGGIAVMPFATGGIPLGTALEITGYVHQAGDNVTLEPVFCQRLDLAKYLHPAKTGSWDSLLDYNSHGGELVQVEGVCTGCTLRGDGTVAAITLVDSRDRAARVVIEKGIGRSTDGKNILHRKIREGRTVRARGLLHRQPDGTVVIRVRNCEEVVYVPPLTEIPNTADPGGWMYLLWLSAAGLIILMPGKPVKARKKSS